jgi:hypothetical protein
MIQFLEHIINILYWKDFIDRIKDLRGKIFINYPNGQNIMKGFIKFKRPFKALIRGQFDCRIVREI